MEIYQLHVGSHHSCSQKSSFVYLFKRFFFLHTIFIVFIDLVTLLLLFLCFVLWFVFFFWPQGMWNLTNKESTQPGIETTPTSLEGKV